MHAEEDIRLSAHPRWVPASQSVTVRGRELGGMIYYGSTRHALSLKIPITACVDPDLPVARIAGDIKEASVSHTPTFAELDPRVRAAYLDWLAGGRSDAGCETVCVLLYFYGLEHCFLLGSAEDSERRAIVAEVARLLQVYGDRPAVHVKLAAFLEVAVMFRCPAQEGNLTFRPRDGHELPMLVRFVIGLLLRDRQPLTGDWMLSWLFHTPSTVVRTPVKRAFPEVKALFLVRFEERFPNGLSVEPPDRHMDLTYTAASGTFSFDVASVVGPVPEIEGLREPVARAAEVAEGVCRELDKFSRYLGRNPNGRDSIDGHLLLPEAIRPLFRCSRLDALRTRVNHRIKEKQLITIEDLVYEIEYVRPRTLGKARLAKLNAVLAALSAGMTPDPRFAIRKPRAKDRVMLFRLAPETAQPEVAGPAYRDTLLVVSAAALVAHSDGRVPESERRQIEAVVDEASGLSPSERARLRSDVDWLVAVRPTMASYRYRLRKADSQTLERIARATRAVALADGRLVPKELQAIDQIRKLSGLNERGVRNQSPTLHVPGEAAGRDRPLSTQPFGRSAGLPGQALAAPAIRPADALELDPERVSAIRVDTDRVSAVVDEILRDDNQE